MINTELLKQRAKELGIRQKDIADTLGLQQSSVNLKLNNQRPMTIDEAETIANLLSISDDMFASYFFSGRDTQRNIQLSCKEVRGMNNYNAPCSSAPREDPDRELAFAIIDLLRPHHLRIRDVRRILRWADELLECVVLQEKAPERK